MTIKKSGKTSVTPEPRAKRTTGSAARTQGAKPRKRPTGVADRHPARPRKIVAREVEAPLKDALVMPVTLPERDLLRKIDLIINRGAEVTLVQGKSSVQVTGETLAALRQIFAALNAGPLSLLLGDSRDTELTSQEAADLLNVSRPYVVKLAREGKIPHIRVGNRHRFLLSDIQEHNQRHRLAREQALASMAPEGGYSDEDF